METRQGEGRGAGEKRVEGVLVIVDASDDVFHDELREREQLRGENGSVLRVEKRL